MLFCGGGNGKLSYQYYLIYLHIFFVEWCIYFFGARAKLNKTARNTAQNKHTTIKMQFISYGIFVGSKFIRTLKYIDDSNGNKNIFHHRPPGRIDNQQLTLTFYK